MKIKIAKIRVEKGDKTTITNEIQRIIKEYFENLCLNKLENLEEMGTFVDAWSTKIEPKEIRYLNRL
jgi:hypothetical protein